MRRALATLTAAAALVVIPATTAHATTYGWHWAGVVNVYDGTGSGAKWKVAEAVREWDRTSKGLQMRLVSDPAAANIVVTEVADTCGNGCAFVESLPVTDGVVSGVCRIELETWMRTKPVAEEFALHEMGHCLGLDHAPAGVESIMSPTVSETNFLTRPTAYDKADMQSLYGR